MNKIEKPNTTSVPNVIFDYWMAKLKPLQCNILFCICRKTFGWHKEKDRISLRQLEKMTGLSRSAIVKGVEHLVQLGLVTKIKSKDEFDGSDAPNQYEVNVFMPEETEQNDEKSDGGSIPQALGVVLAEDSPLVHGKDTQKKDITKERHTKEYASPNGDATANAVDLSSFFFQSLKEINPKIRTPNLKTWQKQLDAIMRIDRRSQAELEDVIQFLVEESKLPPAKFRWCNVIKSPESLGKNFASVWMEMRKVNPQNNVKLAKKSEEDIFALRENIKQFIKNSWAKQRELDIYVKDNISYVQIGNDKIYYDSLRYEELMKHSLKKAGLI